MPRIARPALVVALVVSVLAARDWGSRVGAQDASPQANHRPGGNGDHAVAAPEDAAESPYAPGFDPAAPIRALDAAEIERIRRGEGAGFALPAELNGAPGPSHVLALAERLGLSAEQRAEVEAIFDAMRGEAIPAGERYLAAELRLEEAFRHGTMTEAALAERVAEVGRREAELATIHLAAHLRTATILTAEQTEHYERLRGYR